MQLTLNEGHKTNKPQQYTKLNKTKPFENFVR